jgi:insulin receptor
VIEGYLAMLLLDELKEHEYQNVSFPDLVEVTGYVMLYRVNGFKSLGDLFPNLTIIRGRELFKDYSLIVYEMLHLEELGLNNLMRIERGNVRIEKNDKMCFYNTIDWSSIIMDKHIPHIDVNNSIVN